MAILSFKILEHLFNLMALPKSDGVKERWEKKGVLAVTFAARSDWYRILNTTIALIAFVGDAGEDWGFSRFGTHCLENFFGLIRRNAVHDDRPETAERIIVKTSIIAEILHKYDIAVAHRNRSNLGGVTISPGEVDYESAESTADVLLECIKRVTDLDIFSDTHPSQETLIQDKEILQEALERWIGEDSKHNDQYIQRPSSHTNVAGSRIRERTIVCSSCPSPTRQN